MELLIFDIVAMTHFRRGRRDVKQRDLDVVIGYESCDPNKYPFNNVQFGVRTAKHGTLHLSLCGGKQTKAP